MNKFASHSIVPPKTIAILGIRGIPARHGGFETFAENLAPFLADQGWAVTVYCQEEGSHVVWESQWNNVRRVHIGCGADNALATVRFDWACISHAIRDRPSVVLTLGYNTAAFCARFRLAGIPNVINMDGIEWSRQKWGRLERVWLYLNDWAGCLLGNHLVADHPEIARHLRSRVAARKITTIPYGVSPVSAGNVQALQRFGLKDGAFATVVARPEPENSILEIVQAFSARPRGVQLAVLGTYDTARNPYHERVVAAAGDQVRFVGAIYDADTLHALRKHCVLYIHGHRVGGTNPSLLEAMGAGNAVLAHDNRFNRWVAGEGAEYFQDVETCTQSLDHLLANPERLAALSQANVSRAHSTFAWRDVLAEYGSLLSQVHHLAYGRPSWPHLTVPLTHDGEINQ